MAAGAASLPLRASAAMRTIATAAECIATNMLGLGEPETEPEPPLQRRPLSQEKMGDGHHPMRADLTARDFDPQVAEFQVSVAVLNGFTVLGIPVTKAAG